MKYKAELIENRKIVATEIVEATHPDQVLRSILPVITTTSAVAVINQKGDRWLYIITVSDRTKTAHMKPIKKAVSQYDVDLIFADVKPILENL